MSHGLHEASPAKQVGENQQTEVDWKGDNDLFVPHWELHFNGHILLVKQDFVSCSKVDLVELLDLDQLRAV